MDLVSELTHGEPHEVRSDTLEKILLELSNMRLPWYQKWYDIPSNETAICSCVEAILNVGDHFAGSCIFGENFILKDFRIVFMVPSFCVFLKDVLQLD